ncbi:MAG TPA: hypothetical protein VFK02_21130 [Kofleriaceae bacterium]|nr:hypothetical protein [Kofleriaceae bacterium]
MGASLLAPLGASVLALLAVSLGALAAGCHHDDAGTSVRVALAYDNALGLETADVTLGSRTESGKIAHELLLLVPDELAGTEMPIEVWARKAGKRSAYGTTTAVPQRGKTVAAELSLTACTPACTGDMLMTCTGPMVSCALGCTEDGDAHCVGPHPSNGVDPTAADAVQGSVAIAAATTFDTSTGAITGGLVRAAGTGVIGGVGYVQAPPSGTGGAPLGIFVFHNLTIASGVTVRFTGTRAAVILAGDMVVVAGTIEVKASAATGGPGGGAGGSEIGLAQGCGAGGPGVRESFRDSGGGGGGGGEAGGPGGDCVATPGGASGTACLPMLLEPLQGGSGGGAGSRGNTASAAAGGGGGGALQITALGTITISGAINAAGAHGQGGPASASDGGSGAGGGAGGAILLEAPTVVTTSTAILAANGGGGGGGGGTVAGGDGQDGRLAISPCDGGNQGELNTNGGTGGALDSPPDVGGSGMTSSGGGGGGIGAIVIRGRTRSIAGMISPHAVQADVHP